ncbi:hypothetical protein QE152_g1274 [Popillia japonica]|uniref:Uncharacterized protein n=1 Tax=Popillia japonica TaxID=7064 RepID=A0AAW1N3D1_POPJA
MPTTANGDRIQKKDFNKLVLLGYLAFLDIDEPYIVIDQHLNICQQSSFAESNVWNETEWNNEELRYISNRKDYFFAVSEVK